MQYWKTSVTCLLLIVSSVTLANDEPPLSSSVTLEFGKDSNDSKESYLDFDTELNHGIHLKLMAGSNRFEQTSDSSESTGPSGSSSRTTEFETRSSMIGISSDYSDPLVAGFEYAYNGNPDTLETRTRRFKLGGNTDNWYVQLIYEDRTSRFYTGGDVVTLGGRVIDIKDHFDIDSIGRGIDISFYGLYPLTFNASYLEYRYQHDMTILFNHPLFNNPYLRKQILSPSTLGMATGLESWRSSADASYSFDWGVIGLNGSQSKSAVDESIASTGSLYVIWDFKPNWSTTFTWGKSGTDTSDETVRFTRVALTHRW